MEWTQGYDDGSSAGTNVLPAHEAFIANVSGPTLRLEKPQTTEEQLNLVLRRLG